MAISEINGADVQEAAWFIRPTEAARLAAVSVDSVYRAINAGALPARRFRARGWLIAKEDLRVWLEASTSSSVA